MRKGGTISLALKPSEQEDSIVLELSDTGCGIPQDALRMVFEPYFTTRDEDHATGLGTNRVRIHRQGPWRAAQCYFHTGRRHYGAPNVPSA